MLNGWVCVCVERVAVAVIQWWWGWCVLISVSPVVSEPRWVSVWQNFNPGEGRGKTEHKQKYTHIFPAPGNRNLFVVMFCTWTLTTTLNRQILQEQFVVSLYCCSLLINIIFHPLQFQTLPRLPSLTSVRLPQTAQLVHIRLCWLLTELCLLVWTPLPLPPPLPRFPRTSTEQQSTLI